MIGHHARHRVCRLDCVVAAHRRLRPVDAAAVGVRLVGLDHVRITRAEEVGVERDDHPGLREIEEGPKRAPEGHLHTYGCRITASGVVRDPAHVRETRFEQAAQTRQRRRRRRLGEHGDLPVRPVAAAELDEVGPGRIGAPAPHPLGAVGVVEVEHRGLRIAARSRTGVRMLRVRLDFRRPPFVAFDQQGLHDAPERHRRGVEQRLAGNHFLGFPRVGQNLLDRTAAGRQAGHRHRRPHELQKRAPVRGRRGCGGLRPELAPVAERVGAVVVRQAAPGPDGARLGRRRRRLCRRLCRRGVEDRQVDQHRDKREIVRGGWNQRGRGAA